MSLPESVFQKISDELFSYRYKVRIHVGTLVGGTPTNGKVAEGWIRSKMGLSADDLVKAEVEAVMEARGVTPEVAAEEVARNRHLTGFKRDFYTPLARAHQEKATTTGFVMAGERQIFTKEEALRTFGELYFEGRQVKAMLKEALMIGVASGHIDATKWGATNKAAKGFFAEHLFVEEDRIYLGVTETTEIAQSFVHTFRGAGIKLEEHLHDAELAFTLIADFDFEKRLNNFFGKVFVIGQQNGLGASRSQGFGRFSVTHFERVESDPATTKRSTARARKLKEEQAELDAQRALSADGTPADTD